MFFPHFLFLPFILIGFLSCNCERDFSAQTNTDQVRELTPFEKQLTQSDNEFGLKLFREIATQDKEQNIFISPLSVALALWMTYNGAADSTAEAMKNTLELTGLTDNEINESFKGLIELLTQLDPKVQFEIANSIWYRSGFSVEQPFLDLNKEYFDAEVKGLNFSDPASVDIINFWVNDNTNGKIEEIINRIDPLTMMILINAIYFKGTWLYEFDKELTKDDQFTLADGSETDCKMMQQKGEFSYFETETVQAIELPYGSDRFRMSIFLPKPQSSLDSLTNTLDSQTWRSWISQFSTSKGQIFLPKFKLRYKISLVETLKALGMGIAFEPKRADFSKINANQDLYISDVIHKTYVQVDEEGTEAAAVTGVVVGATSVGESGFVMRVDRPFLFVIWENHSDTILFIGNVLSLEV